MPKANSKTSQNCLCGMAGLSIEHCPLPTMFRNLWRWHAACTWAVSRGAAPQMRIKKNWHLQAASQYLLSLGHAQNIVSWRRFLMSWPHISRCLSGNRVPLVHSLMIMFRKKHGHTWGSITNCQTNRNFFPKDNLPQARATLLSQMHQITVLEVAETKSGCSAFPTWAAGVCITPMGWAYNILLKSS